MIKRIIEDIRIEYRKKKVITSFMFIMLAVAILTYIKPQSTSSIWMYLSLSAINFSILGLLVFLIYWFWWRKK